MASGTTATQVMCRYATQVGFGRVSVLDDQPRDEGTDDPVNVDAAVSTGSKSGAINPG